jgi:hypothetical protein
MAAGVRSGLQHRCSGVRLLGTGMVSCRNIRTVGTAEQPARLQRLRRTSHQKRKHECKESSPHFNVVSGFSRTFMFQYSSARRSRNAFAITDTELNVIAALAITGLSNTPKKGYKTPAAIGTPATL